MVAGARCHGFLFFQSLFLGKSAVLGMAQCTVQWEEERQTRCHVCRPSFQKKVRESAKKPLPLPPFHKAESEFQVRGERQESSGEEK